MEMYVPYAGSALRGCTVMAPFNRLWRALRSKKGQSLAEYALILAFMAIVVVVAVAALSGPPADAMATMANELDNATCPKPVLPAASPAPTSPPTKPSP